MYAFTKRILHLARRIVRLRKKGMLFREIDERLNLAALGLESHKLYRLLPRR